MSLPFTLAPPLYLFTMLARSLSLLLIVSSCLRVPLRLVNLLYTLLLFPTLHSIPGTRSLRFRPMLIFSDKHVEQAMGIIRDVAQQERANQKNQPANQ